MPDKKKKRHGAEKNPENQCEETTETLQEDVPLEEENEETETTSTEDGVKSELEQVQEKAEQLNDRLLRTLAEYDNYRKRTQKEKDSIYPQAQADTVLKFLPIIDNFERAIQCECADTEFKKGIDMIFNTFMQTMKDLNVEEIGEVGEPFNPDMHNAVMHVEDEAYGENVVSQVLQKGYKIGERVVRYAMVQVAN